MNGSERVADVGFCEGLIKLDEMNAPLTKVELTGVPETALARPEVYLPHADARHHRPPCHITRGQTP